MAEITAKRIKAEQNSNESCKTQNCEPMRSETTQRCPKYPRKDKYDPTKEIQAERPGSVRGASGERPGSVRGASGERPGSVRGASGARPGEFVDFCLLKVCFSFLGRTFDTFEHLCLQNAANCAFHSQTPIFRLAEGKKGCCHKNSRQGVVQGVIWHGRHGHLTVAMLLA